MLQDKLNKCRVLISEVSHNKQVDQENQKIVRSNNTFFDAYEKYFVPTITSYVVCKSMGIVSFSDMLTEKMNGCIESSKKILEQKIVMDPTKYLDSVRKLSAQFENEWNSQAEQALFSLKDELSILKLVSNEKQEIQKILFVMNNISKWPVEQETANKYQEVRVRADEILLNMEFDKEIEQFLKKVKDKEATLSDLTDSIIAWIRRENLSNNIMLNIRN